MHAAIYGQGRQTDRQTDRSIVLKVDRQTDACSTTTCIHTYTQTDRQTEISYEDFLADL